jgi:glycosyltransferase involved in cell wall biosynthesis
MRYGVGVQSKVLEAMAAGVPVVVTREASVGMYAEPGRDLMVVDSLEACAAATLHLLDAPEARAELAKHGREYVERNHNPAVLGRQLEAAYRLAIGDASAA